MTGMTKQDWRLYLRLMSFVRPYWRVIILLLAGVLVGAIMEPLMPALMRPLVDESLIAKDAVSLWVVPVLLVFVVVLRGLADYVVTYASQYLSQRVVENLRQALFAIQLEVPIRNDDSSEAGRNLSRITYDTNLVSEAVSEVWLVLIRDTLILVGLVSFLFYTAWELALLVFVSFPILVFAIRKISKRLRASSVRAQAKYGELTGFIQEAFLGLIEIKLFRANQPQEQQFYEINKDFRQEQLRVVRISALAGPIVAILTALTVATVIYFASSMTARGQLTPGEFVAFITALAMVFGPIRRLTATNIVLQRGLAAADAIFAQLDTVNEFGRTFKPLELVQRHRTNDSFCVESTQFRGKIQFRNVSFKYPKQGLLALSSFNLRVEPHEVVVIIGPSGSGKSTVLSLLARIHEPESGEILVDDIPIKKIDPRVLRENIGFVSQRVMLFGGTVRQNISLGLGHASTEQILSAAESAHALDFIMRLPQGLDTPLGALGGRLSGGQRQRIAIARAFLKDAPILLLDEATSALDRESEEAVLDGLERLIQGRTVLMVSHSPERLKGVTRTINLGDLNRHAFTGAPG